MIIGRKLEILVTGNRRSETYWAKIDTGSYSSSIDESVADFVGIRKTGNRAIKTALGQDYRDTGICKLTIAGKEIESDISISERSELKCPVLIGRKDLIKLEALVDVTKIGYEV